MATCILQDPLEFLRAFWSWKDGHGNYETGILHNLRLQLIIIAIASAECKHGFFGINWHLMQERNQLCKESFQ